MTKEKRIYPSMAVRAAKISLGLSVILVVGYFYFQEFRKTSIDFNALGPSLNLYFLFLALFLSLLSYLVDAVIWKMVINTQLGRKGITTQEMIAILFASGLFRYLPGRVWTVAAQSLWFEKYGITKSLTLYINAVCMIELAILSLYFGIIYLAMFTTALSITAIILLFAFLVTANMYFAYYIRSMMNMVLSLAEKVSKIQFPRINISRRLMVTIQIVYTFSWLLLGFATCILAKGLGLHISLADTVPLVASMSLSWLAGFLAVVTPAGLGVREGMMMLMLKPVLALQTALLLPIASRALLLLTESLLGAAALYLGTRRDVFMLKKMKAANEENCLSDTEHGL